MRNAKDVSSPSKGLALGIDQARVARLQFGRHGYSLASWLTRPSTQPPASATVVLGGLGHARILVLGLVLPIFDVFGVISMPLRLSGSTHARQRLRKCLFYMVLRVRQPHRPTRL